MRLLIVTALPALAEPLRAFLQTKPGPDHTLLDVHVQTSHAAALQDIQTAGDRYDAVLVDDGSSADARNALEIVQSCSRREIIAIVLTAHPDLQRCIKAMRAGAWDYVLKNNPDRLVDDIVQSLGTAMADRELSGVAPDTQWINENYEKLVTEYAGRYIVVFGKAVVEAGDTYADVAAIVRAFTKGAPTICRVVAPE